MESDSIDSKEHDRRGLKKNMIMYEYMPRLQRSSRGAR